MATYRAIIEGLELLATYEPKGLDSYGVQAEHDELHAGPDCGEVSVEDSDKLTALGWHRGDADRWAVFT